MIDIERESIACVKATRCTAITLEAYTTAAAHTLTLTPNKSLVHLALPPPQLLNKEGIQESVGALPYGVCIKDGILVVPKNAVIPDGSVL